MDEQSSFDFNEKVLSLQNFNDLNIINDLDVNEQNVLYILLQRCTKENVIKAVLDKVDDLNIKDDLNRTPLFYSCMSENLTAVKVILSCYYDKIDINHKDVNGETVLYYSMRNILPDVLREILKIKDLDVNVKNSRDKTVIEEFVPYGSISNIVELLKRKDINIDNLSEFDKTFIYVLASKNNIEHVVEKVKDNVNLEKYQNNLLNIFEDEIEYHHVISSVEL